MTPAQLVLIGTALEGSRFISEIPTGILADRSSRKLSILIGMILVAFGLMLSGTTTQFAMILVAHLIWGMGQAFVSGAKEAWIADEVGHDQAGRVFLRAAQVDQFARLAAVPVSFALAAISLRLSILLGGAFLLPLTLYLLFAMPERGFRPLKDASASIIDRMRDPLLAGARVVGVSPLLKTLLAITLIYGMASVSFDRLWVAHFEYNLSFPADVDPLAWLAAIRVGAPLIGIAVIALVRRSIDTTSQASIARGLIVIYGLQQASLLLFGLAASFAMGVGAFWAVVSLFRAYGPVQVALMSSNVDSSVRATVLSMSSQVDSFGTIAAGPSMGFVSSAVGIRAAMLSSVAIMSLALPLLLRVASLTSRPRPELKVSP